MANDFEDLRTADPDPSSHVRALARIRRGIGDPYDPRAVESLTRLVSVPNQGVERGMAALDHPHAAAFTSHTSVLSIPVADRLGWPLRASRMLGRPAELVLCTV